MRLQLTPPAAPIAVCGTKSIASENGQTHRTPQAHTEQVMHNLADHPLSFDPVSFDPVLLDADVCYHALQSRDARFEHAVRRQ